MGIYDEMQTVVKELLTEFGQPIKVKHIPSGLVFDVATLSTQDPSLSFPPVPDEAYGVILEWDPNSMIRGGNSEQIDTLIQKTDKRLLIDAEPLTSLKINDTIVANGISYTVKAPLKEINPANKLLMYDCNLRR